MNKRGDIKRLMLEIAYISFAIMIGLSVLYFVNVRTNETSFEAQIYNKDLSQVLTKMQKSKATEIKLKYPIPKIFLVKIENKKLYVNDDKTETVSEFVKEENFEFKLTREGDFLIIEKNEIK